MRQQKEQRKGHARTLFWPLLAVTLAAVNSFFWVMHLMGTKTTSPSGGESASLASPPLSNTATSTGLLNHELIRSKLLAEAPWAESHGADHHTYMGAGMLYYGFAYAFQCKTIVVLGSGGGYVPRVLKQAQRDLELAGRIPVTGYELILIDAHLPSAGYGSTFYAKNEDTVMRRQFRDIRYVFNKTDDAFVMLRDEHITIDYLHIDADHSEQQSWKDFESFVTLLSPRGVVSFHDTCRDEARKCKTGVPQTMHRLSHSLNEYNLQLIDAHYLYRGIAFAVPAEAPALEAPAEKRRNFCKNNAAALAKTSPGFALNKRVGKLPSLGDFYKCDTRFNMTALALGSPCRFGSRRDKKGACNVCIPGMGGENCENFVYADLRSSETSTKQQQEQHLSTADMRNRQYLVAAWLAERDSQHIFEFGVSTEAVSKHILHSVKSVIAVDPLIEKPVWTDDGEIPSVRWLPCKPSDVIAGRYSSLISLQNVDALVCLQCDERIPNPSALTAMIRKAFPRVETVVLEGSAQASVLDQFAKALFTAWEVKTDITLGSSKRNQDENHGAEPRRMILLTRTTSREQTSPKAPLPAVTARVKPPKTKLWKPTAFTFSHFEVAGVNLALYGLEETTKLAARVSKPFELYDDFDLTERITGNESWKDLVRYRRDVQRPSLCFFVDKVARKRWLPSVGLPSPKAFLLKYASELTDTGRLEDEEEAILNLLPKGMDFAAKPTHLSCSGGVWLTKTGENNTTLISHGTKKFEAVANFDLRQIADSLARDLHEGPRCGRQAESWALENVKPGVMIEERFTNAEGNDDSGGMEFKVITVWGRVWLAQWRPGVSAVRAFIHRNGTTLDWEKGHSEPLPDWIDWQRVVAMAEQLGAHKDMFRTDIFVGVPAGSLRAGATREERLAAVQYVVSETEIHPTPIKGTDEILKEAGRLWLAGYRLGIYRAVPDTEVPPEFLESGSLAVQAQSS